MKFTLYFTPAAEKDVSDAFGWYKELESSIEERFLKSIEESLNRIKSNPEIFQVVYKNVRRALLRKFPYGVFYIISDKKIIVIAVLHLMRNPERLIRRIK